MPELPHDKAPDEKQVHADLGRPEADENGRRPTSVAPRAVNDGSQSLADAEQTAADSDQTDSDSDQTGSDSDQASAEADQCAADHDQAASDRDLAAGVDAGAHEYSREIRERTTRQRDETASARLEAANARDDAAHIRDIAGRARDQAAAARDRSMAQRDAAQDQVKAARRVRGGEVVVRAAEQRHRAAENRARAAEQRKLAADDRREAALDRVEAASARLHALTDREALARDLAIAAIDPLTGARTRGAGLGELDRELDRCRRMSGRLVVGYVDIVGLKAVNDARGHAAGDDVVKSVAAVIKNHVRSYDLLIRVGGDEFLCVLSDTTLLDARHRFSAISAALGREPGGRAISVGFAELTPSDTAAELIARADRELIDSRHANPDSRASATPA